MAGERKWVYKGKWYIFYARELMQHFGIYLFQGLVVYPRIEYEFNPQCGDRIAVVNSYLGRACRED